MGDLMWELIQGKSCWLGGFTAYYHLTWFTSSLPCAQVFEKLLMLGSTCEQ